MNFQNPYLNPFYQQPVYQQPTSVTKVNGENGARAFQIGANSSALLLDETGLLVWLITTDGAGYKTVTPYDITPHKVAPAPDYGDLESRIKRLEDMLSDTTDTYTIRRRSDNTTANKADDSDVPVIGRSTGNDKPAYAEQPSNESGHGSYQGIRE